MDRIICVVGPTASGKTALAVELAKFTKGEVVSCDSMQIYRRMDIGTAKPTIAEMEGIPHHMVGIAEPTENWSVAKYVAEADKRVQDILDRGKLPILVGGTGLYLDSLIRGIDFAAGEQGGELRLKLQERLANEGAEALLNELRIIDSEAAGKLHLKDEKRIVRALEVYYETGQTITEHNAETKKHPPRYDALYIGLDFEDRDDLRARIDKRVEQMVELGLLEEVEALLASDADRRATAWQAIGYKQFLAVAEGKTSVEKAIEEVKLRSRQYAKRQLTWLRRNENIFWIRWEKEPNFPAGLQKATEYLLQNGLR